MKSILIKYFCTKPIDEKLLKDAERHDRKFCKLERESRKISGIANNPNHIVTNLTGDTLTPEEERVLSFGLKHGLATSLNESDVVASAESIWDQLQRKNLLPGGYIKQQKIKNSIKALACNSRDFEDRKMSEDSKHIKILKTLREKYAILKPDKGNGVVLIKKSEYIDCLSAIFSDATKFRKLEHDPTFTQLNSLQRYLRTIFEPSTNVMRLTIPRTSTSDRNPLDQPVPTVSQRHTNPLTYCQHFVQLSTRQERRINPLLSTFLHSSLLLHKMNFPSRTPSTQ